MKRVLRGFFAATLLFAVGFAVLALTITAPSAAVPCPPGDGGPLTGIGCGGFGNLPCPGKLVCIDDPRDNCCPEGGGADCPGVCVRPRR